MRPTAFAVPDPETESILCPEPGIYEDIPFREYCEWDAINASRLKRIEKSPAHYIYQDNSDTPALRFGRLLHGFVLEPMEAPKMFQQMPDFGRHPDNVDAKGKPSKSPQTKWCRDQRAAYQIKCENTDVTLITQAELTLAHECVTDLHRYENFRRFVPSDSRRELSIVWHDKHTGLRCKARLDCVFDEITDVKTCEDPDPRNFPWDLYKYGYHCQAAHYQTGWKELTGDEIPFNILAVGKSMPRMICGAPVGEESLQLGRVTNLERMHLILECKENNAWPGYEDPAAWDVPDRYLDDVLSGGTEE